ncbi:MAG TPA: alpha-amylase family glycosyl hydrolase [Deltaproteobacteria bacterium]|nr:alpha-amylase family glycosyl hydrolase [Deltaproteobacteria bacterium]
MTSRRGTQPYFPHNIQISSPCWRELELGKISRMVSERGIPEIIFFRQLALKLNRNRAVDTAPVHAGQLNLYATLLKVYRYLIDELPQPGSDLLMDALQVATASTGQQNTHLCLNGLVERFPPHEVLARSCHAREWLVIGDDHQGQARRAIRELLLLRLAARNPALDSFREILDDRPLLATVPAYANFAEAIGSTLANGPKLDSLDMTLLEALLAPINASPGSLSGQLGFIREQWGDILPPDLLTEMAIAFDILLEEEREWGGGGEPGPPPVMEFGRGAETGHGYGSSVFGGYDYPEYERFSRDQDWMPNVVLMAKMVYVWLEQLSKQYGHPVTRLDQVPDAELDRLASSGFTALWLIGLWERSPASQRIKQLCGNPDAIASAYSLYDYEIAADLGGWEALASLRERAFRRGIRLASDMVPNHTGIYSRWVIQHPDWFVQTDYPPFPNYQFNGEDLSHADSAVIQVEDGYWTRTEAAVVFRYIERASGRTRYIYHGNDGTSIPWNDTAQLNYLLPEVREAVIQTILHVARNFPIIRFDAAMTLAKKHYQRLWFPARGLGGGIPSRAEHGMNRDEFDALFPVEFWREVVDRVAAEVPDTLLLAEAFWLMEGYFVRTLGMHRVYNSAFMNMLKMEDNAKYRQTIRNVLEFNPEVLKRFVNFMNNPDEKTAVEQFGSQGKYFGACTMLCTMPGLPMFGHGQIEGLKEKYGMEYKRAYWDEGVDQGLVRAHEMWIFPLLRRRWLFSGAEGFALYDFHAGPSVDENVFAYSNRVGPHRALVLYHNRFASTAGWIRGSVSFAVKVDGDRQELRQTTLGDALGLRHEPDVFYAFRDIFTGLEYLRSAAELHEKGLYAELGEYECHVFLDFREITDDGQSSWSTLCTALSGRGVASLDVELLQRRYPTMNAAFKALLEAVPTIAAAQSVKPPISAAFTAAARRFDSILRAAAGLEPETASQAIPDRLCLLADILAAKRRSAVAANLASQLAAIIASAGGCAILATCLLFRDRSGIAPEQYGLDHTLQTHLAGIKQTATDKETTNAGLLQPLLALIRHADESVRTGISLIASAFELPEGQSFLQVHESGGMVWFNKERFEALINWLALIELYDTIASPPGRAVSSRLAAVAQQWADMLDSAAHAGYRTQLFLTLIGAATSTGQQSGEKKGTPAKHAKRPEQPHTAKTPHGKVPR